MIVNALRDAIEFAPSDPGAAADGLLGWTDGELFVCVKCAGRIHGRGCGHVLVGADPVWIDRAEKCCLCQE